ncbi:uncharacterized protein TNIN_294271 [Trichonephila inaurata madagascariensis]|uniref:Mutator-like transposase domain-containing protein n=1 Tax=Trichonephila inaurata madagascariensis TaxID=2747483 RepID=A0A8X6XZK1_9ARAC|nr:uncharacterized protein TNIN_294271 [Trichonephila inaurata madagascariensis]
MPVLRETGASLDIGFEKCAAPEMFTGEQGLVKHIHDDTMTCRQPAERKIECEPIHVVSKPIVSPGHLDGGKYFLEDQTIELLEPDLEQNGLSRPEMGKKTVLFQNKRFKFKPESVEFRRLEEDEKGSGYSDIRGACSHLPLPSPSASQTLMGFENPCSFPQNETSMRPGYSKDISHPNLNIQSAINLENECNLPDNGMSSLINEGTVTTPNFSENLLHSDQEVECLNQLAVLGALSTGSGFSQEREKFSVMNMTYMSKHVFASCERMTGTILDVCVENNLANCINEEKRLSQFRQVMDTDRYYCLTVIVDGGWCKRSYGHGNKICLICQAVKTGRIPDKNHICYKNWKGSSTDMESNIIVEGVQFLETVHHICCTRIMADEDSNVISSIQEKLVMVVEC